MYGADLLRALQTLARERGSGPIECFGLGGERMREAGCDTVVDARDVAVVGLAEVVSHLPGIYRAFHRLLREVDRCRPDVAVLVDFPDWNFRLARQLHRRGIPVIYYVSPQLWAWRQGRIKLVQRYVKKMLVIFPFEREFYARHGVDAEFVGHPLTDITPPDEPREAFAVRHRLAPDKPWIAILPGSRHKELMLNLPGIMGAIDRLGSGYEYLLPVASTLQLDWVRAQVEARRSTGSPKITFVASARTALAQARAGIVASGTATVEAAVIGTPFVMIYRVTPLTWFLGRRLVKLTNFGMVNLIAGREVAPELVQKRFTPEAVENALRPLLSDGPQRSQMLKDLAEIRGKLSANKGHNAAEKAARAVWNVARP